MPTSLTKHKSVTTPQQVCALDAGHIRAAVVLPLLVLWALSVCAQEPAPKQAANTASTETTTTDANATEPHVSEEENALLIRAGQAAEENAAAAFQLLRTESPADGSPALDFAQGVYALQAGKEAEAKEALRTALKKMPLFHRARSNLAKLLVRGGDYTEAADELRTLLDGNAPGKGEFWRLLAFSLSESGHPEAAETAFRNALIWAPEDENLRLGLLRSLLQQEDTERAAPMVRRELARDPKNKNFWGILANMELSQGRQGEGLVLLECARRVGAADTQMLLAIGDLKLDAGLPAEAVDAYQAAMASGSVSVDRPLRAARALARLQRPADARRMLKGIRAATPTILPVPQRLALEETEAEIALLESDTARAQTIYNQILADDPLHPGALFGLAELLHRQNKLDEAVALYERAESLDNLRVKALTAQARIAVARGAYQNAVVLVSKALQEGPSAELERYLVEIKATLTESRSN